MSEWISVKDRMPKTFEPVLLSGNKGTVFVGHKDKPSFIWQVYEPDGKAIWVYDPEAYTDDIDSLKRAEDCGFNDEVNYNTYLSVTSINYDKDFEGIVAWMPLPKPYEEVVE